MQAVTVLTNLGASRPNSTNRHLRHFTNPLLETEAIRTLLLLPPPLLLVFTNCQALLSQLPPPHHHPAASLSHDRPCCSSVCTFTRRQSVNRGACLETTRGGVPVGVGGLCHPRSASAAKAIPPAQTKAHSPVIGRVSTCLVR